MVLQGGPCGRVDRRRTQFNDEPHLLIQVGLIFFHISVQMLKVSINQCFSVPYIHERRY
jgi:hypothetical protein